MKSVIYMTFALLLLGTFQLFARTRLNSEDFLLSVDVDSSLTKIRKIGFDSDLDKIGERMVGISMSYTGIFEYQRNWFFSLGAQMAKSADSTVISNKYYDMKDTISKYAIGYQYKPLTDVTTPYFVLGKNISLWHNVSHGVYTRSDAEIDMMTRKNCTQISGGYERCESDVIGSPTTTVSQLSLLISAGYGVAIGSSEVYSIEAGYGGINLLKGDIIYPTTEHKVGHAAIVNVQLDLVLGSLFSVYSGINNQIIFGLGDTKIVSEIVIGGRYYP